MGLVESNAAVYTITGKGSNALNEYYQVFKARVDTIKAHDGKPGYHLALAQEYLEAYRVKKVCKR